MKKIKCDFCGTEKDSRSVWQDPSVTGDNRYSCLACKRHNPEYVYLYNAWAQKWNDEHKVSARVGLIEI